MEKERTYEVPLKQLIDASLENLKNVMHLKNYFYEAILSCMLWNRPLTGSVAMSLIRPVLFKI